MVISPGVSGFEERSSTKVEGVSQSTQMVGKLGPKVPRKNIWAQALTLKVLGPSGKSAWLLIWLSGLSVSGLGFSCSLLGEVACRALD